MCPIIQWHGITKQERTFSQPQSYQLWYYCNYLKYMLRFAFGGIPTLNKLTWVCVIVPSKSGNFCWGMAYFLLTTTHNATTIQPRLPSEYHNLYLTFQLTYLSYTCRKLDWSPIPFNVGQYIVAPGFWSYLEAKAYDNLPVYCLRLIDFACRKHFGKYPHDRTWD